MEMNSINNMNNTNNPIIHQNIETNRSQNLQQNRTSEINNPIPLHNQSNTNNNFQFNIADNLFNTGLDLEPIDLEPNDFIINLEDSEKKSENSIKNSDHDNQISNIQSAHILNQFGGTIVVISNTEEKKEELSENNDNNVQKCESNGNFVNIINIKETVVNNNTRFMNPRQKKPTIIPSISVSENESVLFFFINPTAGLEEGKHLINMGVKKVEFTDNLHCTAYIYNLKDEKNCENGIETLRNELSRISLIRVIIGESDGSILDMIEKLMNSGVDINRCIFGVLPLGVSNDLSRALGWGDKMNITSDMAKFKLIVHDLAEATSILVDIWEIKLTLDDKNGEIIEQSSNQNNNKDKNKDNVFKRSFINYFSLGFDARVGFGFNKKRSHYRCWNNCVYFWESLKKHFFRKPITVNGFIDSFYTVKLDEDNNNYNNHEDTFQNQTLKENEAQKDLIFQTVNQNGFIIENNNYNIDNDNSNYQISNPNRNSVLRIGKKHYEKVVLKGNPVSLVCQNINYFIGGSSDVWRNSEDQFGLQVYEPGVDKNDKSAMKNKEEKDKEIFKNVFKNADQKLNDQKLEFFTYESTWKLGCLKVSPGDAEKVYHGMGPIIINFRDTPLKSEEDKMNRVYLNIDGEYYHIVKPKELRVRLAKKFNGGKLKFVQKL